MVLGIALRNNVGNMYHEQRDYIVLYLDDHEQNNDTRLNNICLLI